MTAINDHTLTKPAMSSPAAEPPSSNVRRPRRRASRRSTVIALLLAPVCLIWIYPFLWMLSTSLKSNFETFGGTSLLPDSFRWDNYVRAWYDASIGPYFWNSLAITVVTIVIVVATTAMIGYVLGRYQFPGRRLVVAAFVATIFVPEGYTIIPVFDLVNNLGLAGSLWGVILAESGASNVILILLFAGYFRQLPSELVEAATIDGAGFFRIFWSVMLPLAKPVMATAVIMTLVRTWNSFLIPLVLTLPRPELRTLAVGIYSFQGQDTTDWSGMAAASTISLLPVVVAFLFLQRYFIEGISGAVRG